MAVVAIMGVLAAISVAALSQRAHQSNALAAKGVIKAIAVAEEHYRAENKVYLNVSSIGDDGWYPEKTVAWNTKRSFWLAGGSETAAWRALAPDIREPVAFGFKANAGLPTDTVTDKLDTEGGVTLPAAAPVEPWYLIQARADADADGKASYIAAASWTPEIAVVNEGE